MVVAHNLYAMNAQRQYNITGLDKKKSTEKLSSGYRINRAADDAAGLSISEKMRKQARGIDRGVRNAQEGISLCQVADGALTEVADMLHRLTELSVQSANGTNSQSDRRAIQNEVDEILTEIDRIGDTTKFNEIVLFKDEKHSLNISSPLNSATPSVAPVSPDHQVSALPTGTVTYVDAAYLAGCASAVDRDGITHYTLNEGIYQIDSGITNAVIELRGQTVIKASELTNVAFDCMDGTHLFVDGLSLTLQYNKL